MNLITDKQRFSTSLAGVFLTFWLTLFCQHCAAAALPADMVAGQPHTHTDPVDHSHTGSPIHVHHSDCLGKCLQRKVTAESGHQSALSLSQSAPMPPAWFHDHTGLIPDGVSPFKPRPSPDRAILHPLSLNGIQLK
jgi:hypothetical protein